MSESVAESTTIYFVSGFIELILYGIFITLSFASLILLVRRHNRAFGLHSGSSGQSLGTWTAYSWSLLKSPFIVVTVLLSMTVSAHMTLTVHRLLYSITVISGASQQVAYLEDLGEWSQIARLALLVLDLGLADIIIAYRVWLVWERTWWITATPILLVIGLLASCGGLIYQFVVSPFTNTLFSSKIQPWITAICLTTLCTNIYGTVAIAWRIWESNRSLRRAGVRQRSRKVLEGLAILVESAMLWTSAVIFYLALYLVGSPVQTVGNGCAPVVSGITFMMITIRVGLGWAQEARPSTANMHWSVASRIHIQTSQHRGDTHAMQVIELPSAHLHVANVEHAMGSSIAGHSSKDPVASTSNSVFRSPI